MTQPNAPRQAPTVQCTAPKAAPQFATTPRLSGPAPPAPSRRRRRIDGRWAAATAPSRGRLAGVAGLALGAGALSTVAAAQVSASPSTATLTVLVVTLAVLGVGVAGLFRVRWSLDAPGAAPPGFR